MLAFQNMNEVDQYIQGFSQEISTKLAQIRAIVLKEAPMAVESIAYGMPAYKLNNKPLVYFAGYAKHIGFYATPTGHEQFKAQLSTYKQGKGSVQFPINQELPLDLITEIVKFRVSENNQRIK